MGKIYKSWFQGSEEATVEGNVTSNDPKKLGEGSKDGVQYDRKPMAVPVGEDSRKWEQTWFEGAANKTKQVMGPKGTEFELKKKLQRIPEDEKVANAKVRMGFTRTATPQSSFWTLYADEKPILRASLSDIWGNKLDQKTANFSATKAYAKEVLAKLNKEGFSTVSYLMTGDASLVKKAMELKKSLVKNAQLETMPEEKGLETPEISDATELNQDVAGAVENEAENTAVESENTADLAQSKLEEVEQVETRLVEETAPETTADVFLQLQEAEKALEEAKGEMTEIAAKLRSKTITASQKVKLIKLAQEAQDDAVETLAETDSILEEAVEKADAAIESANQLIEGEEAPVEEELSVSDEVSPEGEEIATEETLEEPVLEEEITASSKVKKFLQARDSRRKAIAEGKGSEYGVVPEGAPKDGNDEIHRAHPKTYEVPEVSVGGKPESNGAVVENVIEQQEKDIAATNKMPSGELSSKANASGKVVKAADADAKSYWQKLYGEGDADSKEFGKDMTADFDKHVSAAVEEKTNKIKRAYEIAEMSVERGLCQADMKSKLALVDKLANMSDEGFLAWKEAAECAPIKRASAELGIKTAGRIPRVGQVENPTVINKVEDEDSNLLSKLANFDWKH